MSNQLLVIDQLVSISDKLAFFLATLASVLFFLNLFLKRDFVNKIKSIQKTIVVILPLDIIVYSYLSYKAWGEYWNFDPLETFRALLFIIAFCVTVTFSKNSQNSLLSKVLFFFQMVLAVILAITPYLIICQYPAMQ